MSDSIADILSGQKFEEPPEIAVIKQFMADKFQSVGKVTVGPGQIIITVASSALAGTLRMHLHELKRLCQTQKRLVIRIGQ